MKICWDNLENMRLTKNGYFLKNNNHSYVYKDRCGGCGDPYLMNKHIPTGFCSISCATSGKRNYNYGKKLLESHRKKLSMAQLVRFSDINNHPRYKGGVSKLNIPLFDTFSYQIDFAEKTKFTYLDGFKLLQVKCAYCGKWFIPTITRVRNRIAALNMDNDGRRCGESRFYCSNNCKKSCPTFGQHKYPKEFKPATSREVQPELRQLVLERDDYTCQKCGKTVDEIQIHCHHIDPVSQNPIESADIDNCITFCKDCHKWVHKQSGCKYHELRCEGGGIKCVKEMV